MPFKRTRIFSQLVAACFCAVLSQNAAQAQKTQINDSKYYDPGNTISRNYDPSGPLMPTDPAECRVFGSEWNARTNHLMQEYLDCDRKQFSQNIDAAGGGQKRVELAKCPDLHFKAHTYPICVPAYQEYCTAQGNKTRQVRECFESVAKAVPDNSAGLTAIYDRVQKETGKAYKKANTGKGLGPSLARKMFNDHMFNIARVYKEALRDLAQAKARLDEQRRTEEIIRKQEALAPRDVQWKVFEDNTFSLSGTYHGPVDELGRPNGTGKWLYQYKATVRKAAGTWRNGALEGVVTGSYSSGTYGNQWKCIYANNLRNGVCEVSANGTNCLSYYTYRDGLRNGPAEVCRSGGKVEVGNFRDNGMEGRWNHYTNGRLKEIYWWSNNDIVRRERVPREKGFLEQVLGGVMESAIQNEINKSMSNRPVSGGTSQGGSNCSTGRRTSGTSYTKATCNARNATGGCIDWQCPTAYSFGTASCSGSARDAKVCDSIGSSANIAAYCSATEYETYTDCGPGESRGNQ